MRFRTTPGFARCTWAHDELNLGSLNQSYGQSQVLWNLNLRIEPGSAVSLIGRNEASARPRC